MTKKTKCERCKKEANELFDDGGIWKCESCAPTTLKVFKKSSKNTKRAKDYTSDPKKIPVCQGYIIGGRI